MRAGAVSETIAPMPDETQEQPRRPRQPPAGPLIAVVAASGLMVAAFVFKFLDGVPLSLRVIIVSGDLLVTSLACWLIFRLSRK